MELTGWVAVGLARSFGSIVADGLEHVPTAGPAIIAINHTSIADVPAVLATLFRRAALWPSVPCGRPGCGEEHGHIRFLVHTQVFQNPFIGGFARRSGMIEVGWRQAGTVALKAAREALERHEVVGIYPEGDVSAAADGSPRRFRFGVGRLALETNVPIIPLAHHDARVIGSGSTRRALLGALTAIVRRPTIRMRVGPPIQPEEYAGLPLTDVVQLIQDRVTEVWETLAMPQRPTAPPEKLL